MKRLCREPKFWLILASALFVAVFFSLAVWKYANYRYIQEDLSIFNNVFYNTINGRPFWFSAHGGYSYLGDHLELTLLLLLPFYYFFQSPLILLFFQILLYALSAWPLYLIFIYLNKNSGQDFYREDCSSQVSAFWPLAAEKCRNRSPRSNAGGDEFRSVKIMSTVFTATFLLSPFIQNLALEEFHAAPLVLFFFLWAVYFYLRKKYLPFLFFFILTLLSREDAALTLSALTLVAAWDFRRALWQNKKWWLYPLALSMVWFIAAFKIIGYFSPTDEYKYLLLYQQLFQEITRPWQVIAHFLNPRNLLIAAGFLLPLLFLPLWRAKWLIIALPTVVQVFLLDTGATSVLFYTHYQIFILAGLFLALASSLAVLSRRCQNLALILLLVAQIYTSFYFGPLHTLSDERRDLAIQNLENKNALAAAAKLIPPGASVSAPYRLLPTLSNRKDIYVNKLTFMGKRHLSTADFTLPADTEYFLLDAADMLEYYLHFKNRKLVSPLYWDGAARLRELFEERGFNPIFIADTLVLFKRGAPESIALYGIGEKIPDGLKDEKKLGDIKFLGWRPGPAGLTELWWQTTQPIQDDYFLNFTATDAAGKAVWEKIYAPAFGLLPSHDWPPGTPIRADVAIAPPNDSGLKIRAELVKIQGDIELDFLNSVRLILDKKESLGALFELTIP